MIKSFVIKAVKGCKHGDEFNTNDVAHTGSLCKFESNYRDCLCVQFLWLATKSHDGKYHKEKEMVIAQCLKLELLKASEKLFSVHLRKITVFSFRLVSVSLMLQKRNDLKLYMINKYKKTAC